MTADRWLIGMTLAAFAGGIIDGDFVFAATNLSSFDFPNPMSGVSAIPPLGSDQAASRSAVTDIPISRNPLWAIPIDSLRATLQRPIFLPSRRAPAPVVAAAPRQPEKAAVVTEGPDRPALNLMGVVTGTTDGFAVFLNVTTRDIIRLKVGEGHDGWILRSVKGREAVLEKNRKTAVMGLPTPEEVQK